MTTPQINNYMYMKYAFELKLQMYIFQKNSTIIIIQFSKQFLCKNVVNSDLIVIST